MTFKILAISGSLRAESSNSGLVRMAQRLAPGELAVSDPFPIRDLPFYDGDLDTPETLPPICAAWRAAVADADAILWAAPEYNYAPSGVLKNALDWASRPFGAHGLVGKVSSVLSSAGGGGPKVQGYLVEILGLLGGTVVVEPEILIKKGPMLIAADGSTSQPEIEVLIATRLVNLAAALTGATA